MDNINKLQEIIIKYANTTGRLRIIDAKGRILATSSINEENENIKFKPINLGGYANRFIWKDCAVIKSELIGFGICYLMMDGTREREFEYLELCSRFLMLALSAKRQKWNREDFFRNLLTRNLDDIEIDEYTHQLNLVDGIKRVVLVLRFQPMDRVDSNFIHRLLQKVFQDDLRDEVVETGRNTFALVLAPGDMSDGEITQLADALEATLIEEIKCRPVIGVGSPYKKIRELRISYNQAIIAIAVGSRHNFDKGADSTGAIYLYRQLILERMVNDVPPEVKARYHMGLLGPEAHKVLNNEIMTTIIQFFKNNLNLSETARQLYIHRNTLVYRLDKIQKAIGLDLRNFRDAVTFKMIMMMDQDKT